MTLARWQNNTVQFARLLCELEAAGSELQERANTVWETAKSEV